MAGIAGIISYGDKSLSGLDNAIYARMISALRADKEQSGSSFQDDSIFCANVLPLMTKKNQRFIVNKQLGIICAVDGYIQISEELRKQLYKNFVLSKTVSVYELIPYVFSKYGDKTATHITGSFNLVCYNRNTGQTIITNDRFGFLPLFYYQTDAYLIFGSKIECILATGICKQIEFDPVTIAEHLYFNYPLSDNTYIKHTKTIPNATTFTICYKKIKQEKYWHIGEDFTESRLSNHDSFFLLDNALNQAIEKTSSTADRTLNFSLTGGWDSRVVLSYLMPECLDRLHCYSFGLKGSNDIRIPQIIAGDLNLKYTPFILDDDYLRDSFMDAAQKTIELSNGTRNFKRAHYFFVLQQMGMLSDTLITGIFGDQVLKVGKPQGGAVLSSNTIALLDQDFDPDQVISSFLQSPAATLPGYSDKAVVEEFRTRISELKDQFCSYSTTSEKYIALRFEINLRKYFGNEASSYNDYVYCHSPFMDYNFVKKWLKTKYAGQRFAFKTSNLKGKKQSSELYRRLVMKRYPALAKYPSSRGFSMTDTKTAVGKVKILFVKYVGKKNNSSDGFYTAGTEELFETMLKKKLKDPEPIIDMCIFENGSSIKTDALSLTYWIQDIQKKYL